MDFTCSKLTLPTLNFQHHEILDKISFPMYTLADVRYSFNGYLGDQHIIQFTNMEAN
jgi:hypothetical protein